MKTQYSHQRRFIISSLLLHRTRGRRTLTSCTSSKNHFPPRVASRHLSETFIHHFVNTIQRTTSTNKSHVMSLRTLLSSSYSRFKIRRPSFVLPSSRARRRRHHRHHHSHRHHRRLQNHLLNHLHQSVHQKTSSSRSPWPLSSSSTTD